MLTLLEECFPVFRDRLSKIGFREIIQTAADDSFAGEAQKLAGANTGVKANALVICDQQGHGGMKNDGAEERLERRRAVFRQPAIRRYFSGR